MKRVILTIVCISTILTACSMPSQQDQVATQVATALMATSAAQAAIDTAVAATMTNNQANTDSEAHTTEPTKSSTNQVLVTATAAPVNKDTQSNPTATTQPVVAEATATIEVAQPTETIAIAPTDTAAVLPTDTAALLPTDTAAVPPTNTVNVPPSETVTPRFVITIVIQPTSTLSLVLPTLKPITPIILPTIRLP